MKEILNCPMVGKNTFGMDVKADRWIEYSSQKELCELLLHKERWCLPLLHMGAGSNLLFSGDFKGTVLHSGIKGIEVTAEEDSCVWVRVGAGVVWDDFVAYAVEHEWYGAENLSYIPGEVGASAVQNIGAYGAEAKDLIDKVETVEVETAEPRVFCNEECGYAYRKSVFKKELKGKFVVTYVTYKLSKHPAFNLEYGNIRARLEKTGEEISLRRVRDVIIEVRKEKLPDPIVQGNAGSFFMNPVISKEKYEDLLVKYPDMPHYVVDDNRVKVPAGWLVERSGWKGKALGRAAVHDRQALVLVNLGGASGREVMELAMAVVKSVQELFGIELHPEVNFI